jgi:uncharacterized caspase-like protein
MSNFKNVSPAQETTYPVSVFLAPNSTPQEVARRILKIADKAAPQAIHRFAVKGVGADQAIKAARLQVQTMGYTIRSANRTSTGIVVYVTTKEK